MAQALRSNKEAAKIAYRILGTPKNQQQKNDCPPKKVLQAWQASSTILMTT